MTVDAAAAMNQSGGRMMNVLLAVAIYAALVYLVIRFMAVCSDKEDE